jgi:acylphosphatase
MPGLTPIRVRVTITGRVQGVFFRDSCVEHARAERVAGWVRNRADGSVEAEFEGPPAAVDRMIAWCHDGPPHARVDGVDARPVDLIGAPGFRVR